MGEGLERDKLTRVGKWWGVKVGLRNTVTLD